MLLLLEDDAVSQGSAALGEIFIAQLVASRISKIQTNLLLLPAYL
jgi:hypothetical protein